jgi:hypothetical protein
MTSMHSVHALPRGRALAHDVAPLAALAIAIALGSGPLVAALAVAAAAVLAWSLATLHFPHRVELTDRGVSFHAYGRAHAFAWQDVERLSVRRFLVRDRVLVRIAPSPPWRGRYWLTDGMEGFAELVRALELRQARRAVTRISPSENGET